MIGITVEIEQVRSTNSWRESAFFITWFFVLFAFLPFIVIALFFCGVRGMGGDSESPDFLHQISIYTDIIESPNLQYLNMQIIKSPGSKWKNPHPHFFRNPQISRF